MGARTRETGIHASSLASAATGSTGQRHSIVVGITRHCWARPVASAAEVGPLSTGHGDTVCEVYLVTGDGCLQLPAQGRLPS